MLGKAFEPHGLGSYAAIAVVAGMAILFILLMVLLVVRWRPTLQRLYETGLDTPLVAGLSYFAVLWYALTWHLTRFEDRFVVPLVVLATLAAIGLLWYAQRTARARFRRPSCAGWRFWRQWDSACTCSLTAWPPGGWRIVLRPIP